MKSLVSGDITCRVYHMGCLLDALFSGLLSGVNNGLGLATTTVVLNNIIVVIFLLRKAGYLGNDTVSGFLYDHWCRKLKELGVWTYLFEHGGARVLTDSWVTS